MHSQPLTVGFLLVATITIIIVAAGSEEQRQQQWYLVSADVDSEAIRIVESTTTAREPPPLWSQSHAGILYFVPYWHAQYAPIPRLLLHGGGQASIHAYGISHAWMQMPKIVYGEQLAPETDLQSMAVEPHSNTLFVMDLRHQLVLMYDMTSTMTGLGMAAETTLMHSAHSWGSIRLPLDSWSWVTLVPAAGGVPRVVYAWTSRNFVRLTLSNHDAAAELMDVRQQRADFFSNVLDVTSMPSLQAKEDKLYVLVCGENREFGVLRNEEALQKGRMQWTYTKLFSLPDWFPLAPPVPSWQRKGKFRLAVQIAVTTIPLQNNSDSLLLLVVHHAELRELVLFDATTTGQVLARYHYDDDNAPVYQISTVAWNPEVLLLARRETVHAFNVLELAAAGRWNDGDKILQLSWDGSIILGQSTAIKRKQRSGGSKDQQHILTALPGFHQQPQPWLDLAILPTLSMHHSSAGFLPWQGDRNHSQQEQVLNSFTEIEALAYYPTPRCVANSSPGSIANTRILVVGRNTSESNDNKMPRLVMLHRERCVELMTLPTADDRVLQMEHHPSYPVVCLCLARGYLLCVLYDAQTYKVDDTTVFKFSPAPQPSVYSLAWDCMYWHELLVSDYEQQSVHVLHLSYDHTRKKISLTKDHSLADMARPLQVLRHPRQDRFFVRLGSGRRLLLLHHDANGTLSRLAEDFTAHRQLGTLTFASLNTTAMRRELAHRWQPQQRGVLDLAHWWWWRKSPTQRRVSATVAAFLAKVEEHLAHPQQPALLVTDAAAAKERNHHEALWSRWEATVADNLGTLSIAQKLALLLLFVATVLAILSTYNFRRRRHSPQSQRNNNNNNSIRRAALCLDFSSSTTAAEIPVNLAMRTMPPRPWLGTKASSSSGTATRSGGGSSTAV